jgi:integrase/recombinase XerD
MNSPSLSVTLRHATTASLRDLSAAFLDHELAAGLSPRTISGWSSYLTRFVAWAEISGCRSAADLTADVFESFAIWLTSYRTHAGLPLGTNTRRVRLVAIRAFGKWLFRQQVLSVDLATTMPMPRVEQQLPRQVFTPTEVERVLTQPRVTKVQGCRDRAIMELFYTCGIRRTELVNLRMGDLDWERHLLLIRRGKGGKDRIVPISPRSVLWVKRYLRRSQRHRQQTSDEALFTSNRGTSISSKHCSSLVTGYRKRAGLGKAGSCHAFRHAMATGMLDNGADIRCLQEILGHACLQTTQIYTQVSVRRLQEVHARTHPGNKKRTQFLGR